MDQKDYKELQEELEHFRKEKEIIRNQISKIGGTETFKHDRLVNFFFIFLIVVLFIIDMCKHFFHLNIPLPSLFSLELGMLIVSIKIIWMIQKQSRVEHFQFWILNSIEYRLNSIAKKQSSIDKKISK